MARGTATRERILDAAEQLVVARGFGSTTVDAVLTEADASKGAFFHHFSTKADLGRALVDRYAAADAQTLAELMAIAEETSDDPAEQVVAFVAAFEQATVELTDAQPGCLFVSFIYEAELADAETDEIVLRSVLHWRERILDKLERAAANHPVPADIDLPSLADQVFAIFEGGFLLARALDDRAALRRQLAHLRHYLALLFSVDEGSIDVEKGTLTSR
jgi:TetR/AcrR family transcriptional regulator, transcriptional repressor for nem operon